MNISILLLVFVISFVLYTSQFPLFFSLECFQNLIVRVIYALNGHALVYCLFPSVVQCGGKDVCQQHIQHVVSCDEQSYLFLVSLSHTFSSLFSLLIFHFSFSLLILPAFSPSVHTSIGNKFLHFLLGCFRVARRMAVHV